jgi:hypothetical protein
MNAYGASKLSDNTIDIIVSYLPLQLQSKISQKYYSRVAPLAIKKIIRAIKDNRIRMNAIMNRASACTNAFMQAHYILYYPHNQRYTYFRQAMMILVLLQVNIDFIQFEQYRDTVDNESINVTGFTDEYLFRKLISIMTMEELLLCSI